jgi:hypothetical protein
VKQISPSGSARHARNRRLADALQQWAFCAMRGSPGTRKVLPTSAGQKHQPPSRATSNWPTGSSAFARLSEDQLLSPRASFRRLRTRRRLVERD